SMPPTATPVEIVWTALSVLALVVTLLNLIDALGDFAYWSRKRGVNGRRGIAARANARAESLRFLTLAGMVTVGANAMAAAPGVPGFLPAPWAIYLLMMIPARDLLNSVADRTTRKALIRKIVEVEGQ
ncbi:MAG: hypothetical protein ACRDHY_15530, partial [Anaerolineales bacterium]